MKKFILPLLVTIWLGAAIVGMILLSRFQFSAGPKSQAPQAWPANSNLKFDDQAYNLVLSLHPKCSCSNATLGELEKILAATGRRLKVHALMSMPAGAPQQWRGSDLVKHLYTLPQTEIHFDENCQESELFGALTSGDTMLFDPFKQQVFRGGITASRGHSGDNVGENTIIAISRGLEGSCHETPVFGCNLDYKSEIQR
jgi:hypothetical protein